MNHDDPFMALAGDQTLIRPTPGARMSSRAQSAEPFAATEADTAAEDGRGIRSGLDPLVAAANPLLNLAPQLRSTLEHADPMRLRQELSQAVRDFEVRARASGLPNEQVVAARYILCTLLDEAAASTPWGPSVWARQSLLVEFHGEAWGGDKVFQLLAKLASDPAGNLNLLELIYVCLQLGFEGRYRVLDGGQAQLAQIKSRLHQLLRKARGEYERELSPHWRSTQPTRLRRIEHLPFWAIGAFGALALLLIYAGFSFALGQRASDLAGQIAAMRLAAPHALKPAVSETRLARFLAEEIALGLVEVNEYADRSIVTLRGDGLFQAGSERIDPRFEGALARIAAALRAVPGSVEVAGHTDNVPMRSLRFASNWELSKARAESVMHTLSAQVPARRMRAVGRADTEPVASNDTPTQRARNRRVDIVLFGAPAGATP